MICIGFRTESRYQPIRAVKTQVATPSNGHNLR
jgi:hypothetical protein